MLQNSSVTAALAFATAAFTIVGLVSVAFAAIPAVRMFWRVLLAIPDVAIRLACLDVRKPLQIALLSRGWERWSGIRSERGFAWAKSPLAQRA